MQQEELPTEAITVLYHLSVLFDEGVNEQMNDGCDTHDNCIKDKDQFKYVEEFFLDKRDKPSPRHSLEESPCYPIIGKGIMESMEEQFYYCILHLDPLVWSPDLRYIEHHCKHREADNYRTQILKLLSVVPIPSPNKDWMIRKKNE